MGCQRHETHPAAERPPGAPGSTPGWGTKTRPSGAGHNGRSHMGLRPMPWKVAVVYGFTFALVVLMHAVAWVTS
jgi:hypothetical protein